MRLARGRYHLALLLMVGCTSDLTQLMVAVDTDYAVPSELSLVKAYTILEARDRTSAPSEFNLASTGTPLSFGVVPEDGDVDLMVIVVVEGYAPGASTPIVTARARTGFIEGKTLYLPIFLGKSCRGISCGADQTCVAGSCQSADVPPENLSIFDPDGPLRVPRPDGGVPDGGVPDGGVPDGGVPDGGTPDGGTPDGGEPDSGVDCELPIGLPAQIGSVPMTIDPNRDILADDLDGDGIVEFVIAHGAPTGGSPFVVLDFDDCETPVLTSSAAFGELRQGFVASSGSFYSVERSKIERWRYMGAGMITQDPSPFFGGGELERLAFSTDGRDGVAIANVSSWAYHRIDPSTGGGAFAVAPERPKSFSAHFSGDRFFHSDDFSLRRVDPPSVIPFGTGARVRDPAVAVVDDKHFVAMVMDDVRLRIIAYKEGSISGTSTITFPTRIIAGPTAAHDLNDARFYVLLDDGTLTGCEADEDDGRCDVFNFTRTFPSAEIDDKRELLTAWIDGDQWPDIVFVGKGGHVYFVSGNNLSMDVAPTIDLMDDTKDPSAIAPTFFSAYGVQGALLVVPHSDHLSLVAWSGSTGPSTHLWSQFRGSGTRSAQVP